MLSKNTGNFVFLLDFLLMEFPTATAVAAGKQTSVLRHAILRWKKTALPPLGFLLTPNS
jgi:hypothetical protein